MSTLGNSVLLGANHKIAVVWEQRTSHQGKYPVLSVALRSAATVS